MGAKNTFICFICGESSENSPGFCSVNFHQYSELKKHEKKEQYLGAYLLGAAHSSCLEKFSVKAKDMQDACFVCCQKITDKMSSVCSKLAIYEYRKKGCREVLNIHDQCVEKIKHPKFIFTKYIFGK